MDHALLERIRRVLEQQARAGQTISYRALAIEAEVPGPQVIHRLTHALEEIQRQDCASGAHTAESPSLSCPSLACLAVSRGHPLIPRPGFFILLRELGLYDGPDDGPQAEAFHADLLQRVRQSYAGK